MKVKKHMKNITGMIGLGLVSGAGTMALDKAGMPTSVKAIGGVSSFMPLVGTGVGMSMAMDAMSGLNPKSKKKKK